MFSPAAPRSRLSRANDGPPSTPLQRQRDKERERERGHRQGYGPSSPLTPRTLSATPARTPPVLRSADKKRKESTDESQPVFVSDFPSELRSAQAEVTPGMKAGICGGVEKGAGLCWMLYGARLYVWSHLSNLGSEGCRVLVMPQAICTADGTAIDSKHGENWSVCIVGWQDESESGLLLKRCESAAIVMCSRKSTVVVYWPDIFSENTCVPVLSYPASSSKTTSGSGLGGWNVVSMVACGTIGSPLFHCTSIACRANGELWRFDCGRDSISRCHITREAGKNSPPGSEIAATGAFFVSNSSGARSIVWRAPPKEGWRQALLLTATKVECWNVELKPENGQVSLVWASDILPHISKDLAGQKQVWLLDLQVNTTGTSFTLLLASHSKDRLNSSSFTQYSLAFFGCDSDCLKKEGGVQVILPKARVEEEEFLNMMRLRMGGKPEGSAMILASDGTATVAYYNTGFVRLYQFDLAWDAGKVVDASVVPSSDNTEDGTWLVMTENAGLWAIPGKAVLYCGVEPPERSLSRRGSLNEGTTRDERSSLRSSRRIMPATIAEGGVIGETIGSRALPIYDDEAEALVIQLFQDFLDLGEVGGALEKLEQARAFEREGELNVFARASRSLVDTLAKQWTSGGIENTALLASVSSQLIEKRHRHQKFLQFLAASKCHEELQQRQRSALNIVLEHGEKLAAMLKLREVHNASAQSRFSTMESSEGGELGGALWDLVQLAGEKARQNNVMLMDREKSEVFYSRVSELEDLFGFIDQHATLIIGSDLPLHIQVERTREVAHAYVSCFQAAVSYRNSQQSWYPSPEGLTPWYCKAVVRSGLWTLAGVILELKAEATMLEPAMVEALVGQLEEVTDILLEAYAGAITAKVEREEEFRGLQTEYWTRRDLLLGALLQHARALAEASSQEAGSSNQEHQKISILQRLYSPLLSLARRHAGYQTLWDICTDLNDLGILRSLMRESMGLKEGRFSKFVFEQCYGNSEYAKLMRLGEEFQEELAAFLQSRKELLWLHELYMHHFTLASATLHSLAFSEEKLSSGLHSITGNHTTETEQRGLNLVQRRRLLNLAKLSVLAGQGEEAEERAAQMDAELGLLDVLELACRLGEAADDRIPSPRQLVEICLKSEDRDLALRAFAIFTWENDMFRRGNKSLLEAAWLRAADLDRWTEMREASEREGWSDEQHLEALRSTALFHLSQHYYGEGGLLQDVLPLLQEDKEGFFGPHVAGTTAETVLMQHPEFPDAGQAMLTAIRMGRSLPVDFEAQDMDELMNEI